MERSIYTVEHPSNDHTPDKLLEIASGNLDEIHIAIDRVNDSALADEIRTRAIELGNALSLLKGKISE